MAEQLPEKPPKKVKVHSLGSFWWRIVKMSFKHAWEPFETVGGICALLVGMLTIVYLVHQISQERVDYMIYWSIAVPVAVWWVFFLWNLIKIPHKIYKEDLGALTSGATPVPVKEITSRNFGRALFVVIVVSAFVGLLSVEDLQIAQLKSQPKPIAAARKPLPDKIIPKPEPPPTPVVSTQQVTVAAAQIQFETSTTDIGDAESELAKSRAQKLADLESRKLHAQALWTTNLPMFNYSLETLYEILSEEAKRQGDGISKTVGYFQCLPATIDHQTGEMNVAEIRFQTKTNLDFKVMVTAENWDGVFLRIPRTLNINCSCGGFSIWDANRGNPGDVLGVEVNIPDINEKKDVPAQEARDLIKHYLKILIAGQIDYLSTKNK